MKKIKVSLLALAVLAGGAIGASAAASSSQGSTFEVDIRMPSNAPISFVSVSDVAYGAAALAISNANFVGVVDTDGSGKIQGSGFTRLLFAPYVIVISTNGGVTNVLRTGTGVGDYNTTVSGKISTKNNLPNVQESVKGTGYSSARGTNVVAVDGSDGSYVFFTDPSAASSSFNVNFTGNAALVIVTNGGVQSYNLAGNYKGSVKPGKNVNNGKSIQVNEAALLEVDRSLITDIDLQVVKFGSKFWANVIDENFNGSGNISGSGKATANFKGFGFQNGDSFKLTGQQGNIIIIIGGKTNTVAFLGSVDISGKFNGQTVSATGATVVQIP